MYVHVADNPCLTVTDVIDIHNKKFQNKRRTKGEKRDFLGKINGKFVTVGSQFIVFVRVISSTTVAKAASHLNCLKLFFVFPFNFTLIRLYYVYVLYTIIVYNPHTLNFTLFYLKTGVILILDAYFSRLCVFLLINFYGLCCLGCLLMYNIYCEYVSP